MFSPAALPGHACRGAVGGAFERDGIERAIEISAQVPDAATGEVEVRPVLDLDGLDP